MRIFLYHLTDVDEKSRAINARASKISYLISLVSIASAYLTGLFFVLLPIMIDIYRYSQGLVRLFGLPFKSV